MAGTFLSLLHLSSCALHLRLLPQCLERELATQLPPWVCVGESVRFKFTRSFEAEKTFSKCEKMLYYWSRFPIKKSICRSGFLAVLLYKMKHILFFKSSKVMSYNLEERKKLIPTNYVVTYYWLIIDLFKDLDFVWNWKLTGYLDRISVSILQYVIVQKHLVKISIKCTYRKLTRHFL